MKQAVIVVGPTKAGSSWVWEALKRLGSNLPAHEKEIFFFDLNYASGLDWYFNQYGRTATPYCDVAPTLFRKVDVAAARISEVFDECIILILMREPVERAISDYHHFLKTGRCQPGLRSAIGKFPEILEQSRYSRYVPIWEAYFPVEVVDFEAIKNTPDRVMRRLGELCGADSDGVAPPGQVNETKAMPSPLYGYLRTQVSLIMTRRLMWRLKGFFRLIDRGIMRALYLFGMGRSADLSISDAEIEWVTAKLEDEVSWYNNNRKSENE